MSGLKEIAKYGLGALPMAVALAESPEQPQRPDMTRVVYRDRPPLPTGVPPILTKDDRLKARRLQLGLPEPVAAPKPLDTTDLYG